MQKQMPAIRKEGNPAEGSRIVYKPFLGSSMDDLSKGLGTALFLFVAALAGGIFYARHKKYHALGYIGTIVGFEFGAYLILAALKTIPIPTMVSTSSREPQVVKPPATTK